MESLKILVVEDEELIADTLQEMLEMLGHQVLKVVGSGEDAVVQLCEEEPDLILLDIQLKGKMDGIDVAKLIKQKYNIPFIFTTAFADEAIIERAKNEGPYGYVVKPYGIKDILAAIEVAMSNYRLFKDLSGNNEAGATLKVADAIYLKEEGRLVRVALEDILFVEAKGDYVLFKTKNKQYVIYSTLKKASANLPEEQFFQVHRSFIVNLGYVEDIEETSLSVPGKHIPVSRSARQKLLERLNTL